MYRFHFGGKNYMGVCNFVRELNKLRKSSSESIDNVGEFDEFKKYMHVVRNAEEDLKSILIKVNQSGRKTLVLLCGSAGDGKSHLLSYLKNEEPHAYLADYIVHNDATESSAPSKTAIETLNELLVDFRDVNLDAPGKNIILAINLGVLSNFIESEYGSQYMMLKDYVNNCNILSTKINDIQFLENSHFQHVSFSDYHMYSITKDGIRAKYIEELMEKIFQKDNSNPFYLKYVEESTTCPLSVQCPIKHNFEFMMEECNRKYIADLLVEVIVKDKIVLTTREILNFIYDILVSQEFDDIDLINSTTTMSNFIKKYISMTTPALLFDYEDLSILLNYIKKYDPLQERSEKADEETIAYYISSDVIKEVKMGIKNTAYERVLARQDSIDKFNEDKEAKKYIFNLMTRVNVMQNNQREQKKYNDFLKYLYYYNAGNKSKLQGLYDMVEKAVMRWCDGDEDSNVCLDDQVDGFLLFERIEFDPCLDHIPSNNNNAELNRFLSVITIEYENKKSGNKIMLNIDYSLYELMYKLSSGYVQTADDRNNHADFISFVNKILKSGNADKTVYIISDSGQKATLEKNKFGYKFKVVN